MKIPRTTYIKTSITNAKLIKIQIQLCKPISEKVLFEVFRLPTKFIENLVNLWPEVESNLGMEDMHRFFSDTPREMKVCPQIFKSMQVNSDGKVIPCCIDFKGLNDLGNLEREDLSEIWNGTKMRDLRVKHLRGERHEFSPCKGCTMNEYADTDTLDDCAEEILKRIKTPVHCLHQQQNLV